MTGAPGDLIDADAPKAIESVAVHGPRLGHDPAGHPTDRLPVDAHQPGHHALGGVAGEPRAGRLECRRETRPRPGEAERLGADTASRAAQARTATDDHDPAPRHIQVAPPADAVIMDPAHHTPTASTAPSPSGVGRHLHLQVAPHPRDAHHPHALKTKGAIE